MIRSAWATTRPVTLPSKAWRVSRRIADYRTLSRPAIVAEGRANVDLNQGPTTRIGSKYSHAETLIRGCCNCSIGCRWVFVAYSFGEREQSDGLLAD